MVEISQADHNPRATDLAARAARLELPAPALTAADLMEAARVDRDPRTSELAARAARLTQPEPGLTPADLVEIGRTACDPHAVGLAARAARLPQPAPALTTADLVEVARADRKPRAVELAMRAARLAQPAPGLTLNGLVEIAHADRDPRAVEMAARAAQLARALMLDRREIRARDVLALPFAPPPAPAALAPALAKVKRADEAVALARAVEHQAQIALDQHRSRRRPGRLIGWLTGARARYDAELRTAQDVAEMRASQCQRADVAAVIARKSARRLTQQHERATTTARDADARRRDQARAQLRWCSDARIALRDFPDLAAKNIHEAIEAVRRTRERFEEINYNHRNRVIRIPRC